MRKLFRKSQLYIITALFLSAMAFMMSGRPAAVEESSADFPSTYSNFVYEAKYAINSALYLDRNLPEDFSRFTDDYIEMAESEGISVRMFYALAYDGRLHLGNRYGKPVNITSPTAKFILTEGNRSVMEKGDWLNAEIEGRDYLFNTSMNVTGMKLVFRMDYENTTEVRTHG
ncbi:MAG: hypothetical protein R6U32_07485 [Candidatus Woesearchaeota archaeon]